jgi:hypothetical protein
MKKQFKDVEENTNFVVNGMEFTKVKQYDSAGCCNGFKPINAHRVSDKSIHYFNLDTEVEVKE